MARKKKQPVVHKPLNEFYTDEQRKEIESHKKREHHRKTQEQIESDIFEHIKEHTKKVLKEKEQKNNLHYVLVVSYMVISLQYPFFIVSARDFQHITEC